MPRNAAVMLCMVLAAPAQAEIYRWTDANGSLHFSDKPPQVQKHTQITVREPVTMPLSENIRQSQKVRQSRRSVKRMLAPDSKQRFARADKESEALAARCEKYRQQLDQIQSQLRAGYSNDRGNSLRQKRRKVSQLHSRNCMLK